jgi:hypothetical protein
MIMFSYEAWAPPGRMWGPWVEIGGQSGGVVTYRVNFDTVSGSSTFDAEIQYFQDHAQRSDIVVGPGSHTFTAGICVCITKIRFRSHSLGQIISVSTNR